MLNIILKVFIKEIKNHEIRKKIIKNIITTDRSFKSVYILAKETRRINLKI